MPSAKGKNTPPRAKAVKDKRSRTAFIEKLPERGHETITHFMSLVVGAMLADTPFWAGISALAGLAALYLFLRRFPKLSRSQRSWFGVFTSLVVGSAWLNAYWEYRGQNLQINYKVCGGPIMKNGLLTHVFLGIEFENQHSVDLVTRAESARVLAGDDPDKLPLDKDLKKLFSKDSEKGPDRFVSTTVVELDPWVGPPETLPGQMRYRIKFGKDEDHLTQTLVIDGTYTLVFDDDEFVSFRFSPSSESSSGYSGACNINRLARQ